MRTTCTVISLVACVFYLICLYGLSSLQHRFMISHQLLVFRFRLSHPELIVHLGAESRCHDQSRQLSHMVGEVGRDCWTISKLFSGDFAGQSSQMKLTFSRPLGPSQALSKELLPLALASRYGRVSQTGERSREKEEEARRQICRGAFQSLAHILSESTSPVLRLNARNHETYLRQSGLDNFPRGAEFPDLVENARQLSQRFEENGHETRSLGAAGCSDCEAEAFFGFARGCEDACF